MTNLDVSLRLRLKNDLSREAKKAERDLKELEGAAKGLGKGTGANALDKQISTLGRNAKTSQTAIRNLDKEARNVGKASGSDKLNREIQGVGREARTSARAVRNLDREAKSLNNVKTDAMEKEIAAVGKAGTEASRRLRAMQREANEMTRSRVSNLTSLEQPTSSLSGAMGGLKGSAGAAFGALLAFASVDAIVRGMERVGDQARKLDRDVASVAVTAEMRTPEAMAKISKSNETLSLRYGVEQAAVNDARKSYAAAGFGIEQQEAILDPTLKAAKASDSSGEMISNAVIAIQQNLGVKDRDVPAALDMMAKGAKLGSFEVNAMAKDFPSLASQYQMTGRSGMSALSELVAAAQVVRMAAGSPDQAATNLQNLIQKVSSPDTMRAFAEKGIDLKKVKAKSDKNGTSYMMDVVDLTMKLTGGDSVKMGELFQDSQVKQALAPLIDKKALYLDFLKQIQSESGGTVDADYGFIQATAEEKKQRRDAAFQATGVNAGRVYDSFIDPLKDWAARLVNPDYNAQETARERQEALGKVNTGELRGKLDNLTRMRSAMPAPTVASQKISAQVLDQQIREMKALLKDAEDAQAPRITPGGDPGFTGKIPIPTPRPDMDKDLSGAAESSMKSYNAKLNAGGDQAIGIAKEKAAEIERAFNFTATPTIKPNFLPPAGAAPAPTGVPIGKQSSIAPTGGVSVAQNFYGGANPRLAAIRAQREQNRAIRQAAARSLSDTGYKVT